MEVLPMEIKTFYKTQRELAINLNNLIDAYWENRINEPFLISKIKLIYENNPGKMIKFGDFTTILKQHCGKKRLEIVSKVINTKTEE